MAAVPKRLQQSPAQEEQMRAFPTLEAAARYAEAHDIGEAGPPAKLELGEPGETMLTLRLAPDVLRCLRSEAIRRGASDLGTVAVDLLTEAMRQPRV
jgi:hypothetical protein